jgi:hypothetical protein
MGNIVFVCKPKRKGGTKVELEGKVYHFKPESGDGTDPEIDHTCAIPDTDAGAIWRLLAIKEAYSLQDPDAVLPAKPKVTGQTIAGNKSSDPKEVKPTMIANAAGDQINLSVLAPEELRQLAKEEFGIVVHHKWSNQTVIDKIVEKTRGE